MSRLLSEQFSRVLAAWRFNTANAGETGAGYEAADTQPTGTASDATDGGANTALSIEVTTPPYESPVARIAAVSVISATAAAAVSNGVYLQFTYTPSAGLRTILDRLTFKTARGGASTPRGWALRSSLDNYATDIATSDVSTQRPTWTHVSVDLSAYQSYAAPITFRLYQYAPATGASLEFDDIELHGFAEAKATIVNRSPAPPFGLIVPDGTLLSRSADEIGTAGVVGDFTFAAWVRMRDPLPEQYVTFFALHKSSDRGASGSYFWFGWDSLQEGGMRGLAIYGNNGAHSYPLLSTETWMHVAVTRQGQTGRMYLNGVQVDLDIGAPGTTYTMDLGHATYSGIDEVYIGREAVFTGQTFDGDMAAAFLTTSVLDSTALALLMGATNPISSGVGCWPMQTNLVDALGIENLVSSSGALTQTTGPTSIQRSDLVAGAATMSGSGTRTGNVSGWGNLRAGSVTDATTSTRFTPGTRLRYTASAGPQPGILAFWVNFPVAPTATTTIFAWNVNDSGAAYRMSVGVEMSGGVPYFATDSSSVGGVSTVRVRSGQWYKIMVRMPNADGTGVGLWIDENYTYMEENASQGPFGVPAGSFVSLTINGNEAAGEQGTFDIAQLRWYSQDYPPDNTDLKAALLLDIAQPQARLPTWVDYRFGGSASGEYTDRSGNGRSFTLTGTLQDGQTGPAWMYADQPMGIDGAGDRGAYGYGHLMAGYTAPAFATGSVRFSSNNTGYLTRAVAGSISSFTATFCFRLNQHPTLDFTTPFQLWHSTGYGSPYCQIYLGDGGSNRLELQLDTSTLGGAYESTGFNLRVGQEYFFGLVLDGAADEVRVYVNGILIFTKTGVTGTIDGPNVEIRSGADGTGAAAIADIARLRVWSRALSGSEISAEAGFERAVANDAALIGDWPLSSNSSLDDAAHGSNAMTAGGTTGNGTAFAGGARASMMDGSGTIGGALSGSGDLAAGSATVSGAGATVEPGSGSLGAGNAAVSGTGAVNEVGSGAIAASAATIAGAGAVTLPGVGTLQAGAATMSGIGATAESGSGALSAGAASVAGAGVVNETGTGAMAAGNASVAGVGTTQAAGAGSLAASPATIAGAGLVQEVGSGALAAAAAALSGVGAVTLPGAGSLAASAATLSGVGTVVEAGAGALVAGSAAVAGSGTVTTANDNAIASQPATVAGVGAVIESGSGALVAGLAAIAGAGAAGPAGSGGLQAGAASIAGAGSVREVGVGALQAGAALVSGAGFLGRNGAGGLQASAAVVAGAGFVREIGSGALQAGAVVLTAVARVEKPGSGSLVAGAASLSGAGAAGPSGVGGLVAGAAQVAGAGTCAKVGQGDLQASPATIVGLAGRVRIGSGDLQAGPCVLAGAGIRNTTLVGSGALQAGAATMAGSGVLFPASMRQVDRVVATVTVVPYHADVWVGAREVQAQVLLPDVDVGLSVER